MQHTKAPLVVAILEQQPAPDTVEDSQQHSANESGEKAIELELFQERIRQKQQEGVNNQNEQPKGQEDGNKGQEHQDSEEQDVQDTIDRRNHQCASETPHMKAWQKLCDSHEGQCRQYPLQQQTHKSSLRGRARSALSWTRLYSLSDAGGQGHYSPCREL